MAFSISNIALLGLALTGAQVSALAIRAPTSDGTAPSAAVSSLPIIYGTIKPNDRASLAAALPTPGQDYSKPGQSAIVKPTTSSRVRPTTSPAYKPTTHTIFKPSTTSGVKSAATSGVKSAATSVVKSAATSGVKSAATSGVKSATTSGVKSATTSGVKSASSSTAKPAARKRKAPKLHQRANGDGAFVSTGAGDFSFDCQNSFTVTGPFANIRVTSDLGSDDLAQNSVMSGIEVTDYYGTFTPFGRRTTASGDSGTFSFGTDEIISSMTMYSTLVAGSPSPLGFSFHTSSNNDFATTVNSGGNIDVKTGSGYLARIRGCVDSHQNINSIAFDMLDDLKSLTISKIAYEGFANNLAPSGSGQQVTVGNQAIDNTNSTVAQTTTFTTTKTVTKTHQVSTDHTSSYGGSVGVTVDTGVSVPLLEESKVSVTTTFNWDLTTTKSTMDSTAETSTEAQSITLTCPPGKYCTDVAYITKYTTTVHINATYTATTNSGATFWWLEQGTYTGQDSTSVLSQVSQFNVTQPQSTI